MHRILKLLAGSRAHDYRAVFGDFALVLALMLARRDAARGLRE